jgi:glutathione S-transferase
VPALRTEEGDVLIDNAGIAAYLEARYPEKPMLGTTPQDKADIASWHWRAEFEGLMPIGEVMRNTSPAMVNRALPGPINYPQIAQLAERGLARLERFFLTLNERLEGRTFVAADHLSLADITAVVAVDFARIVKVRPDERHPHLMRWREKMAEMPWMSL